MTPQRYAVHIRLKTRSLNPCTICVYVAFTECHAYDWIDERGYPKSYTAFVKPLTSPSVEEFYEDAGEMITPLLPFLWIANYWGYLPVDSINNCVIHYSQGKDTKEGMK